jgi:hypothetical protein
VLPAGARGESGEASTAAVSVVSGASGFAWAAGPSHGSPVAVVGSGLGVSRCLAGISEGRDPGPWREPASMWSPELKSPDPVCSLAQAAVDVLTMAVFLSYDHSPMLELFWEFVKVLQ